MVAAILLLVSAMVVGFVAPSALRRFDPTKHDPTLVLAAWLSAIVGVLAAVVGSVIVLLLPEHGTSLVPATVPWHDAWHSVAHGAPPRAEYAGGLAAAAMVGMFTICIGVGIVRASRRRIRASDDQVALLQIVARTNDSTPGILRIDHDHPIAFSISGRRDVVVATEGVFRHLGDNAAAAVLAHERAHLRGRHHALVAWVGVLHDRLAFLPLFRHAPAAVAELVELCADVAAARECGDEAVHTALIRMAMPCSPRLALGMANQAIERRLTRLTRPPRRGCVARRCTMRVLGAFVAATVPFHITVALLEAVAMV